MIIIKNYQKIVVVVVIMIQIMNQMVKEVKNKFKRQNKYNLKKQGIRIKMVKIK